MKTNKLFKKLVAFFMTAALAVGCFSITASADAVALDESKVTIADTEYYKGIIGENAPDTANINIGKFVETTDVDGNIIADTNNPVKDVVFSTVKIGDIFQVEDGTTTLMTYGITKTLADKIAENGKTIEADYTVTVDGTEYVLVKDYQKINTALMGTYPEYYKEIINRAVSEKTGEDGYARFSGMEYGLYLVVESSVANAQTKNAEGNWDWITITRKQAPYVVSAPIYDDTADKWLAEIDAKAKNVTGTADIEKKIVRTYDDTLGYDANEDLKDTDVTHVNDTVEFKFTSLVPDLTDSAGNEAINIDTYVITDAISKGLTLPEFSAENIVITDNMNGVNQNYTFGTDYTVAKVDITTVEGATNGADSYAGGSAFTVTFTDIGRAKLTALAKGQENGEVYVYYTATVNSDAIVGEAGNPNKVKLTFQAGQSHKIDTEWDEVKEFIFGMEANKLFDNDKKDDLAGAVRFKLYTDEACTQGVVVTGDNGDYVYSGSGEATELKLDGNSQLYIKGIPTDNENNNPDTVVLYLKETATSIGYNILKDPIAIELIPAKGDDGEYTGVLANTSTVNGTAATLVRDDTAITLAVNNTSGFQLPATGGMGAWIFAILGVLVIGGGVTFYVITRKKRA